MDTAPPASPLPDEEEEKLSQADDDFPPQLLNAPGLVGMIADGINSTAPCYQPVLALAMGLAVASVIYGRKYCSEEGVRSNMLIMSLAPSGSGKEHPQTFAKNLLMAANLYNLVGGDNVTSGTAILQSLKHGGGQRLLIWDEFGLTLKTHRHANAGPHSNEIGRTIMALFTKSDSIYTGNEYADPEKRPPITITHPSLSIIGSSVADNVYAALGSSDAIEGFLARWIVFEVTHYARIREPRHKLKDFLSTKEGKKLPRALLRAHNSKAKGKGNLTDLLRPHTIPYTPEAKMILDLFREDMALKREQITKRDPRFAPFYTRGWELAVKLALNAHEDGEISGKVASWACKVVRFHLTRIIEILQHRVADTKAEAEVKKFLLIVKDHGDWISKRELTRKTQWIEKRRREEILGLLTNETGQIDVREKELSKDRKTYDFKYRG